MPIFMQIKKVFRESKSFDFLWSKQSVSRLHKGFTFIGCRRRQIESLFFIVTGIALSVKGNRSENSESVQLR